MHVIELDDDELYAIPQDKRLKIVQAQIEGGRKEIQDLYEALSTEHDNVDDLEFHIKELVASLNDERRKTQLKIRQRDTIKSELLKKRSEVSQLETKLRSLAPDHKGDTITNSEIDKLANALEKEEANVLRIRAMIEKRNNEIAAVDMQFKSDMELSELELKSLEEEKEKLIDLIELNMQKLSLLKQRNEACMKSVASHSLDAQLTTTLESFTH